MKNLFLIIVALLFSACEKDVLSLPAAVAIKHLESKDFIDITLSSEVPRTCPTGFMNTYHFKASKIYSYRKTFTTPAEGCIYWNEENDIKIHSLIRY